MNHQKGMKKGFSLGMSEVDHKATLWVRDLSQVIISPLLKSFMGFDKLNFPPGDYKAPYVADVTRGVNYLYVYCPLVEPRMVGDAQVPLLRIVPVFKSAVPLFRRGAKTLGREAFKTGLNLASDVMEGQNVTQAATSRLKSTGQSLLQKAMDTVGPPDERSIKRAAKRKKPRRRQTKLRNTSKDIFG